MTHNTGNQYWQGKWFFFFLLSFWERWSNWCPREGHPWVWLNLVQISAERNVVFCWLTPVVLSHSLSFWESYRNVAGYQRVSSNKSKTDYKEFHYLIIIGSWLSLMSQEFKKKSINLYTAVTELNIQRKKLKCHLKIKTITTKSELDHTNLRPEDIVCIKGTDRITKLVLLKQKSLSPPFNMFTVPTQKRISFLRFKSHYTASKLYT